MQKNLSLKANKVLDSASSLVQKNNKTRAFLSLKARLWWLFVVSFASGIFYIFYDLNYDFLEFSISERVPKLLAMVLCAYAIGAASLVFQTIILNRIVTPCLLGMNALYMLIHTAIIFVFGINSIFANNAYASYLCDLCVMGFLATVIYSYLFKLTNYNVLYVLLAGTVMTTFFGSLQSSLERIMDPTAFDALVASLVPSFNALNIEILALAYVAIFILSIVFYKDLKILDVLSLGRDTAINLGVDYDKSVRRLLLGVTLFIATATALVGPISFLGLIIANLSREIFATYKHSFLIVGSVLCGVFILVFTQTVVERIFVLSIPVSVFISIVGGIYFLYLLLANKGRL